MNSKRTIAECRLIRLDFWLARQPLTPGFNRTIEAAEAFRRRLQGWVESTNPGDVAPTFHFSPQAKI